MKNYYRIMLGKGSMYAEECFAGNYVGVGVRIAEDLTDKLPDDWQTFNKKYVPIYLAGRPEKTKVAAGLACGLLWTLSKGIQQGDIVLCPDGTGQYRVGEVCGDYAYAPDSSLPHRRPVHWFSTAIDRSAMSLELKKSTGSIGTVCNILGHWEEIEKLIGGAPVPAIVSSDGPVEDPIAFALEKHLEEFLVKNWAYTDLGKEYDIFEEEGELVGQQYPTDTGPIDILGISKDKKRLVVIELKKGRASDAVVGQVLRYMGYVMEQLAEKGQTVHGVIIALEDDQRIRRALAAAPNVDFFRYQLGFKLVKA